MGATSEKMGMSFLDATHNQARAQYRERESLLGGVQVEWNRTSHVYRLVRTEYPWHRSGVLA